MLAVGVELEETAIDLSCPVERIALGQGQFRAVRVVIDGVTGHVGFLFVVEAGALAGAAVGAI
jgi:hypothetical protein